ncbi:MAG: dihydrolipoamide acetyltransferase [Myxococcota bacterium]
MRQRFSFHPLAVPLLALTLGGLAASAWAADPEPGDPTSPPADGPAPAPPPGPTGPAGPLLGTPGVVGAPAAPADDIHDFQLRELEEKVLGLKEKVFRAKTRLLLLKERLLNDVIAEAKVVVFHENDMGSSFKPVQVLYHLDGEKIYFADDSSKLLDEQQTIEIFNQNMVPGNHVLAVEMVYRGDSAVFAYLKDYLFKLRASYTFYATKGKITTVRAIGYQKGDITYDLRERPSITFDVKQVSYTNEEVQVITPPGTPAVPGTPATPPGDAPAKPEETP